MKPYYDSLESSFLEEFKKHLSYKAKIFPRYRIDTEDNIFCVDFLIEVKDKRIVIEFQTKDSYDEKETDWRDSQLIGKNQIDTIYRFVGNNILLFVDDCIYYMSQFNKDIFNSYYPHFDRMLKYEEKYRTIIFYNMVGADDNFVYRLGLTIDLINRRTRPSLFESGDSL
ncbi:MAG: hypothetical protein WCP85_04270 [Mariniphaga sp.]